MTSHNSVKDIDLRHIVRIKHAQKHAVAHGLIIEEAIVDKDLRVLLIEKLHGEGRSWQKIDRDIRRIDPDIWTILGIRTKRKVIYLQEFENQLRIIDIDQGIVRNYRIEFQVFRTDLRIRIDIEKTAFSVVPEDKVRKLDIFQIYRASVLNVEEAFALKIRNVEIREIYEGIP